MKLPDHLGNGEYVTAWIGDQPRFFTEGAMDLGQKGVFWFTDALSPAQLVELAQRTEELGYAALWYPDVAGLRLLRTAGMGHNPPSRVTTECPTAPSSLPIGASRRTSAAGLSSRR